MTIKSALCGIAKSRSLNIILSKKSLPYTNSFLLIEVMYLIQYIIPARRKLVCRRLCWENFWSEAWWRKRTSDSNSVPVHRVARPRNPRRYRRHPHYDSQDEGNQGSRKKLCPSYSPLQVLWKMWRYVNTSFAWI